MSDLLQAYNDKKTTQPPGWQWHKKELRTLFANCIAQLDRRYVLHMFVDGLDEYEEGHAIELVDYFEELVASRTSADSKLHLLFTCRYRQLLIGKVKFDIQVEREATGTRKEEVDEPTANKKRPSRK